VLNGGNLAKEKLRKYGYYHGDENEDKNYEVVKFRWIDESEMIRKANYSNGILLFWHLVLHPKVKTQMDSRTILSFKLFKCDIKLIRSIFTHNGFAATESHDWNCLWINSSGKSYIYENLNEYQKVNHFPHSYELTRKDRLAYNINKMEAR